MALQAWAGKRWHAWQGTKHILLHDTEGKFELQYFNKPDDVVNWLFLNEFKDDASALNQHLKGQGQ